MPGKTDWRFDITVIMHVLFRFAQKLSTYTKASVGGRRPGCVGINCTGLPIIQN
jgi:hypothetical protein